MWARIFRNLFFGLHNIIANFSFVGPTRCPRGDFKAQFLDMLKMKYDMKIFLKKKQYITKAKLNSDYTLTNRQHTLYSPLKKICLCCLSGKLRHMEPIFKGKKEQ